jgi:poly-gamma-glutamate synthesis protein (capsule biosynthesis protein)
MSLRLMASVGEVSGDAHASRLARDFLRLRPGAALFGMGGERMLAAGMDVRVDITDTSAFGLCRPDRKGDSAEDIMTKTRRTTVLVASDWAPIRAFDSVVRANPESVYGDLLPVLRRADLRIVNCECALTTATRPVWKSGAVFKGTPAHVKGLTAVPFDVACLANNHVLDFGVAGLRQTLSLLRRRGVRTVGAGLTEGEAYGPLAVKAKRTTIHVVNFGEGEDLTASRGGPGVFGWDVPRVVSTIERCRKQGGIVLAIGHCGLEYAPYPPPYVVAAFRAMAEAGAHAVIGHHPHVPQGLEWHRSRPIIYSLGNFVFSQLTDLFWRRTGFCVTLAFDGDELSAVELHPYRIGDAGLRTLDEAEHAEFGRKMTAISRPLATPGGADRAWHAYLAYYGVAGFTAEVQGILEKMKEELPKGAAMFRNRVTTMQHVELWRDALTRMMAGGTSRYPREAYRIIEEWFTRRAQRR